MTRLGRGIWTRLHGAALLLLPGSFRAAHGREMRAAFLELLAEGGGARRRRGVLRRGLSDLVDVAWTGLRLRMAGARRGARGWFGGGSAGGTGSGPGELWRDVRHALRMWARRPAFALVAVVTLALGIGANTLMFSVVSGVLLEPLPYPGGERLVMLWQRLTRLGWERGPISYPNFREFREQASSFEDLAAFRAGIPFVVRFADGVEQVRGIQATGNLLPLLGVRPALGRWLTEGDARPGAADVVVLSDRFWRSRWGAAEEVIGTTLTIQDRPHEVVGVMPRAFEFGGRVRFDRTSSGDELWVPLRGLEALEDRDTHFLNVVGRLRAGATLEGARAEMQAIWDRMRAQYPEIFGENQPNLETRREFLSGDARGMVLVLGGAVALLLAAACANLANLMLMRGAARSQELAVRAALGAGRRRLIRQLLTESGLLAAVGAVGAAAVAAVGLRLLLLFGPQTLPRREAIDLDAGALAFTALAAAGSVMLFGLVPAWRAVRPDMHASLREGARTTFGRKGGRLQRMLVVAQVAVAMVLLTGGGLLLRSFLQLSGTRPGFDPRDVLMVRLAPPSARYPEFEQHRVFFSEVFQRLRALPGTRALGAAWALPFSEGFASGSIVVEGLDTRVGEEPTVGMYPVLGDYFGTMRIALLAGRDFGPQDGPEAPPVAIVNQAMAATLWPGQEAVGRRFKTGGLDEFDEEPWVTVVGVVGDARRQGLDQETEPEAFFPHAQRPWARELSLVLRTDGDPLRLVPAIRAEVRRVDPNVPLTNVRTLEEVIAESVSQPRFRTLLLTTFAALAVLLALVGMYGVMGTSVTQRRHEIGVRMALGARHGQVLGEVVRSGAVLVIAGLAIGAAGALLLSRFLAALLYGITPVHAPTYLAVAAVLAAGGLFACYVPARRASRTDPLTALRQD